MSSRKAFTLLEAIVALGVVMAMMVVTLEVMTYLDQGWKTNSTDPFEEAQDAFEIVAHNLAAATLAPYQDYADGSGAFRTSANRTTFAADHPARRSDLDFVCGPASGDGGLLSTSGRTTAGNAVFFVAPTGLTQTAAHTGMENLLNAMGNFVEFGDDDSAPGFVLLQSHTWRWRMKQIVQPSESLRVFSTGTSPAWIQQLVPTGASIPVLAENIIALVVLPERAASDPGSALAPAFSYDSRDTTNRLTLHQLPPRARIVLVAIDEASAERLAAQNGTNPPPLVSATLFQQASQLDTDIAALNDSLTTQKIGHRIFQREILLPASDWSNTPSP